MQPNPYTISRLFVPIIRQQEGTIHWNFLAFNCGFDFSGGSIYHQHRRAPHLLAPSRTPEALRIEH
jgi:hypothetical protein